MTAASGIKNAEVPLLNVKASQITQALSPLSRTYSVLRVIVVIESAAVVKNGEQLDKIRVHPWSLFRDV